ncbi:MAG TPA: ABC transporter ATP-binding protein [Candidatus Elarobacter sp.]|jgi:putative ABC transport system ATP-binding protein|nr:ABC transporter ATP-binding protein [Candidatus Elarobacter sp.]
MPDATLIEARELRYRYPRAARDEALRGASLRVAAGEIVLLRGHSGSGKTTLLCVLSGLLTAQQGSVRIDGVDLATMDAAARTRLRLERFGFVFQRFALIAALRARENVELVLRAAGATAHDARAQATATLEALGIGAKVDRLPAELSGGEQQRVAIARALAKRPSIVFADEPTSSLDSASGMEAARLLCALARDENAAVVIASHDDRIAPLADRVVEVTDGRCS